MEEIKATTTYTKENFMEFQKYHFFKRFWKFRLVFTLFGLLFCLISIVAFFEQDIVFGITELVLGIFLLIEFNTPIFPYLQGKHFLKSDSMTLNLENQFTFKEKEMIVENKHAVSKVLYDEIYCVKETEKFFYIYINKMNAFLLEKANIKDGKVEEVRRLLQNKLKK